MLIKQLKKKLIVKWSTREEHYLGHLWNKLTPEERKPFYDFDTYGEDQEWIDSQVEYNLTKFSIAGGHDSRFGEYFPHAEDWGEDSRLLYGCHTLHKVTVIYFDENGLNQTVTVER